MTSNVALALTTLVVLTACNDSGHPDGRRQIPQIEGNVVATVGGQRLTAAEVTAFAADRDNPSVDALVERELLAQRAVDEGLNAELARKRAMVRAYLADEIETKVTAAAVPDDLLASMRTEVTAELQNPGGYEVVAVRVYSRELMKPGVSEERRRELEDKLATVADRLWESLPEENALSAVLSADTETEDDAVAVNIVELKIASPGSKRVKGFSQAPRLAAALADVPDGGKSPIFVTNGSPVFAVRRSRIEPKSSPPEVIEQVAVERALAKVRTDRMVELLEGLRETGVVVTHLDAFEEEL